MLKDSEISRYSTRRTHRTYAAEFKAELVAACQQPGVSIAALAGEHGMNANVLHRWLKEHQRSAGQPLVTQSMPATREVPAFVPVPLAAPIPQPKDHSIRIELRKGALAMVVTWPLCAVDDFASWTTAVLK
jgi:transposase-like protein